MKSGFPVRKAVVPAAGYGTRLLPATKSVPKEMLTIVDRPAIDFLIEEIVNAGIRDILIVTSRNKRTLEDYFDRAPELENLLKSKEKGHDLLGSADNRPANIFYKRQGSPLGSGHAIMCARPFVDEEPFVVAFPDDILLDNGTMLQEMIDLQQSTGGAVAAVCQVPLDKVSSYGVLDIERELSETVVKARGIIEKPPHGTAPSNYCVIGRYVLPAEAMSVLGEVIPDHQDEIQLTSALEHMASTLGLYGHVYSGERFDIGNKLGYVEATLRLAMNHQEIGADVAKMIEGLTTNTHIK